MSKSSLIPQPGERALIVGQTGSGKTAFAVWLLERFPQSPVIIYDTKIEGKFPLMGASRVVTTKEECLKAYADVSLDYVIFRPDVDLMWQPAELDNLLKFHYQNMHNSGAYIDELYTFHRNGQAGPGLVALLTRGRSKGITFIGSTQRPVRIDRFCITESQKVYVFRLTDIQDKKRLDDVIPNFSKMDQPPKHGFYSYDVGEDAPTLYGPINLDAKYDTGYVDISAAVEDDQTSAPSENNPDGAPARIWL